jgi:hypothetical protein
MKGNNNDSSQMYKIFEIKLIIQQTKHMSKLAMNHGIKKINEVCIVYTKLSYKAIITSFWKKMLRHYNSTFVVGEKNKSIGVGLFLPKSP